MIDKSAKIVLTGAAGLVGQNLIVELKAQGYTRLVAIDKHEYNLGILRELHPDVEAILADLAEPGAWEDSVSRTPPASCNCTRRSPASIRDLFVRNNIDATRRVLDAARASSSAVPRAHQLVGGQFGRRRRLHEHQEGAGEARRRQRHASLHPAADADVRLVRSEASGLAVALHGEDAGLPDPRRRPLHAPAAVRTRFLPLHRQVHRDASPTARSTTSAATRASTTSTSSARSSAPRACTR